MEKDYSLLRPFDLEAAKLWEKICSITADELWDYIDGPDCKGNLFLKAKSDGRFIDSSNCPCSVFRMSPIAWVEGNPVYRGDVLYWKPENRMLVVSNSEDQGWIIGEDGANYIIKNLTWKKPKTKRYGWVNVYEKHRACWRYDTKEEADLFATLAQGGIDPARIACVRCEWEE